MRADNSLGQFARHRRRLLFALALGALGGFVLPFDGRLVTHLLIGWNVAVWCYLLLMGWLMFRASPARVRAIAEREDPGAVFVLALMSVTAIASLAAIVVELSHVRGLAASDRLLHYAFTASTVLGSWLLVNTMFTFHYAHMFFRAPAEHRPLSFPDKQELAPDYWDFLYFSFTIAAAAQTSDVTVMTRPMRKAVLAQSVLSFIFNAAIIGMSINVAAGMIGS